jgi:glycosyltransferase involved in cell wall biosynthesis
MNYLFLRGKAAAIYEKSDMWQSLFINMVGGNENGEMICYGKKEFHQVLNNFSIICTDDIKNYEAPFEPNVIFSRGGFGWNDIILNKYKSTIKIYYGAGPRYNPKNDIYYDIILTDCKEFLNNCKLSHSNSKVVPWIKPAHSDFAPPLSYSHEYDICYIGNTKEPRPHKGHKFVKETCPKNLSILHLGYKSEIDDLNNVINKLVSRNEMSYWIGKCKVGIIPSSIDYCPRAMPEMLACGLPVIALDTVNFWPEIYRDVIISNKENFWNDINKILNSDINHKEISDTYQNELSMEVASSYLKNLINEKKYV